MDNRGFSLRLFLVIATLLMVVVLAVYLVQKRESQTIGVAEFYDRYLRDGEINKETMTEKLSAIVKEKGSSSFLCVDSISENITIEKIEEKEGIFEVHASHLNNPIRVILDDNGKMAYIECPPKEEIETGEVAEQAPLTEERGDSEIALDVPLALRAKNDLALRLSIDISEIKIKSAKAVMFSDLTLGMSAPGEVYNQKLTPGYLIILSANEKDYRYHADETQTIFVP